MRSPWSDSESRPQDIEVDGRQQQQSRLHKAFQSSGDQRRPSPGGIADGVSGRGLPIERYDPPREVVEDAKRIVAGAGMELSRVEYLVNERDGRPYFYDVNTLSNFVANAPEVIGFDPFVDLVDFLLKRARTLQPA